MSWEYAGSTSSGGNRVSHTQSNTLSHTQSHSVYFTAGPHNGVEECGTLHTAVNVVLIEFVG